MPRDHKYWFPIHEAGHVAICHTLGIEVQYAIASRFDRPGITWTTPRSSNQPIPQKARELNIKSISELEASILTAGFAAEKRIWHLEKEAVILKSDFLKAAFDRCKSDMDVFFSNLINPPPEGERLQFFVGAAQLLSENLLDRENAYFDQIRQHLSRYGYIGSKSIGALQSGIAVTCTMIAQDHELIMNCQHADLLDKNFAR